MSIKKKLLPVLLGILLLFSFSPAVNAEDLTALTLSVNGKVYVVDPSSFVENGTVMVPFRATFEGLGAAVTWNNDLRRAYATKDDITVTACIPCQFVSINDVEQAIALPPRIINDRVIIPISIVNGLFGASISETAAGSNIETVVETPAREYKKITAEEAKAMMGNKAVTIIDVRSAEEYAGGHVEGALLIPVGDIEKLASINLPDKNATLLVYCGSGVRSAAAAKKLVEMGYTDIYDFGGLKDWPYGTSP